MIIEMEELIKNYLSEENAKITEYNEMIEKEWEII